MSGMEAYVEARARFCRTKAEMQSMVDGTKKVFDKVANYPGRLTLTSSPDPKDKYYSVDPAQWPDREELFGMVERFKADLAAMDATYKDMTQDQKAAMNSPESPNLK